MICHISSCSEVVKVVFYYKKGNSFVKIDEDTSSSNEEFSINVPSLDVSLGEMELKAESFDKAGNVTEKIIKINVTNASSGQSLYESDKFVFDMGNLTDLLKETNLEESLINGAKQFIENNTISREFQVVKTNEDFIAKIIVSFEGQIDLSQKQFNFLLDFPPQTTDVRNSVFIQAQKISENLQK